jgi:hypothetical protein
LIKSSAILFPPALLRSVSAFAKLSGSGIFTAVLFKYPLFVPSCVTAKFTPVFKASFNPFETVESLIFEFVFDCVGATATVVF